MKSTSGDSFRPAWGLGNPHAQTIWPAVARKPIDQSIQREMWRLQGAHAVDVVLLPYRAGQPGVLLLHGLEGSYQSSYMQGMLAAIAGAGWNVAVLEFRSCGPTPPEVPELYHSGKTDEIAFVVQELQHRWPGSAVAACGFSLGGNALLKWMGETGTRCPLAAAVAISVPFSLAACASSLDAPNVFARVYRTRFLRSLKRKACRTAQRHHVPFTVEQVKACTTLRAFDDLVTAPLFGFASAEDYWDRNSSQRFLAGIARPALVLAAADDPFIPRESLPEAALIDHPTIEFRLFPKGGHTGFVGGSLLRPRYDAEAWVVEYLQHWI